jgi:hypothetical protein
MHIPHGDECDCVLTAYCRAAALHENLASRLNILADLHWSQPRPLSAPETRFSRDVLPGLQKSVAAMQRDVQVCGRPIG